MEIAMHTTPKSSPLNPRLFLLLLLLAGAGYWIMQCTKDGPVYDEINQAIEEGITLSTDLNGCNNYKLRDFKTPGKWRKQFRRRGFSVERIRQMLTGGRAISIVDPKGQSLVRVVDPATNDYLVIDPKTCEIWQVAPASFLH